MSDKTVWAVIEDLDASVTAAEHNLRQKNAGGQQVPFHGDFASAPPSTLIQLRRWVDALIAARDS